MTLRVDIFQHKTEGTQEAQAAAPEPDAGTSDDEVRRRARMGEIQTVKNSRLVGENRYGLLTIMRLPPGEYGNRVEAMVAAENADRSDLMKAEAVRAPRAARDRGGGAGRGVARARVRR